MFKLRRYLKRYPQLIACAILMIAMQPAAGRAQGMKVSSPIEFAKTAAKLKPGQWVWAPEVAPSGPVMIYVDLSSQIATIYRNGVRIGVSTISSGKKGYETPTGVFTILQKDPDHHSNKYENAAMPFQQRITWDGVALHAGGLPGYPESHGCIHLPYVLAKALFQITNLGATVIVDEGSSVPMAIDSGSLLFPLPPKEKTASPAAGPAPDSPQTLQTPRSASQGVTAAVAAADKVATAPDVVDLPPPDKASGYEWHPERSPSGPVTVIVSRIDQTILVLRNGVEIGRSQIVLPATDFATHVLTLTVDKAGTRQWLYVGVPGHAQEAGKHLDSTVVNQVKIPQAFKDALVAILQPGSTILVTESSLSTEVTGEKLVVMNAAPAKPKKKPGKSKPKP